MTDWAGFVGFTGVVLALMLALAWLSRDAIQTQSATTDRDREEAVREFNRVMGGPAPGPGEPRPPDRESVEGNSRRDELDVGSGTLDEPGESSVAGDGRDVEDTSETGDSDGDGRIRGNDGNGRTRDGDGEGPTGAAALSSSALLANVAITQGLFLGVLAIGLWWTDVPAAAVGLAAPGTPVPGLATTSLGWSPTAIALGVLFGAALYVFNQVGAALGDRVGIDSSTELREALAPDAAGGWVGLLGAVLPVVAVFEELLFRGALIGGFAVAAIEAGFPVSPWVLAGASAIAFALGHGAQGRGGIVVTGALGAVLGAAFVLTWSLPLVIVAHYVVNAVEFAIHEGFGIEWI